MSWSAVGSWISSNSPSTTFTLVPNGVGNLIVLSISQQSNGSSSFCTSVTSSNVNWQQVTGFTSSSPGSQSVWIGRVLSTSSATVTTAWSGTTPAQIDANGHEFSSTVGSWIVDAWNTLDQTTGTNTWASVTPTTSGDLFYGYGYDSGTAIAGSTPGYVYNVDSYANGEAYNLNCTSAAQAPVWGDSGFQIQTSLLIRESPISILQHSSGTVQWTSGTNNSLSVSFQNNTTAGSTLVACVTVDSADGWSSTSVTSNGSAEYWSYASSDPDGDAEIWIDINTPGGQSVIVFNIDFTSAQTTSNSGAAQMDIYEVAGLTTAQYFDTWRGANGSSTTWSSNSANTSSAPEIWFGVVDFENSTGGDTVTVTPPSSPWFYPNHLTGSYQVGGTGSTNQKNMAHASGYRSAYSPGSAVFNGTGTVSAGSVFTAASVVALFSVAAYIAELIPTTQLVTKTNKPYPLNVVGGAKFVPQNNPNIPNVYLSGRTANVNIIANFGSIKVSTAESVATINVVANFGSVSIFNNIQPQFSTRIDKPYPLNLLGAFTPVPQNNINIPILQIQGSSADVFTTGSNVLSISDFENGAVDSQGRSWSVASGGYAGTSTFWYKTGSNSLLISGGSASTCRAGVQHIPVASNSKFQVSTWIMSPSTGSVYVEPNYYDSNNSFITAVPFTVNVTAGVPVYVDTEFTVPGGAANVSLYIISASSGVVNQIYVDDVVIQQDTFSVYITTNFQPPLPFNVSVPYPLNLIGNIRPQSISVPISVVNESVTGLVARANVVANFGGVSIQTPFVVPFNLNFMDNNPVWIGKVLSPVQNKPANIPNVYVLGDAATLSVVSGNTIDYYNFETGLEGWTLAGGVGAISQSSQWSHTGNYSALLTGSTNPAEISSPSISASIGQTYQASAWLYSPQGVSSCQLQLFFFATAGAGVVGSYKTTVTLAAGVPQLVTISGTCSAGVSLKVVVEITATQTQTVQLFVDDVTVSYLGNTPGFAYITTNFQNPLPLNVSVPYPLNLIGNVRPQAISVPTLPPSGANVNGPVSSVNVVAPLGTVNVTANVQPQWNLNFMDNNPIWLSKVLSPVQNKPANIPYVAVQGDAAVLGVTAGNVIKFYNFEPGTINSTPGLFSDWHGASVSTAYEHTGQYSLFIPPGNNVGTYTSTGSVSGPGAYQLTAWVYSVPAITISAKVQYTNFNALTAQNAPQTYSIPAGVPTQITYNFFVPNGMSGINLTIAPVGQTLGYYVDDVIISYRGPAVEPTYITTNFQTPIPFNVSTPYPLNLINGIYPQNTRPANIPGVYVHGDAAINSVQPGTAFYFNNYETGSPVGQQSTVWSHTGNYSGLVCFPGSNNNQATISNASAGNKIWQATAVLYSPTATTVTFSIEYWNTNGVEIYATSTTVNLTAGVAQEATVCGGIAPANTGVFKVRFFVSSGGPYLYADDITVTQLNGIDILTPFQSPQPFNVSTPHPLNLINGIYPQNTQPASIPGVYVQGVVANVNVAANFGAIRSNYIGITSQVNITAPVGTASVIKTVLQTLPLPFNNSVHYPLNIVGNNLKPKNPGNIPGVYVQGEVATLSIAARAYSGIYITTNFQPPLPFNVSVPHPLNMVGHIKPQNPASRPTYGIVGLTSTVSVSATQPGLFITPPAAGVSVTSYFGSLKISESVSAAKVNVSSSAELKITIPGIRSQVAVQGHVLTTVSTQGITSAINTAPHYGSVKVGIAPSPGRVSVFANVEGVDFGPLTSHVTIQAHSGSFNAQVSTPAANVSVQCHIGVSGTSNMVGHIVRYPKTQILGASSGSVQKPYKGRVYRRAH